MVGMPNDEPGAKEIADRVGPFWSEAKVCAALGIAAQALAAQRDAGTILGLTTSDAVRVYPVAQFRRHHGTVEVEPALVPLLTALRAYDPWTVAVFLYTFTPELDGQTPLDWVRRGGSPYAVSDLGRVVAQEWAAGAVR